MTGNIIKSTTMRSDAEQDRAYIRSNCSILSAVLAAYLRGHHEIIGNNLRDHRTFTDNRHNPSESILMTPTFEAKVPDWPQPSRLSCTLARSAIRSFDKRFRLSTESEHPEGDNKSQGECECGDLKPRRNKHCVSIIFVRERGRGENVRPIRPY